MPKAKKISRRSFISSAMLTAISAATSDVWAVAKCQSHIRPERREYWARRKPVRDAFLAWLDKNGLMSWKGWAEEISPGVFKQWKDPSKEDIVKNGLFWVDVCIHNVGGYSVNPHRRVVFRTNFPESKATTKNCNAVGYNFI